MTGAPQKIAAHRTFGGETAFYKHESAEIAGPMTFAIYLPPQAEAARASGGKLPALLYLAGLTCDHTTFITKAGALGLAAEHGFILVAPDTSPRDKRYPGDRSSYDVGIGAGFYVDAMREPWSVGYRMGSYVAGELPVLVDANFPSDPARWGVFGHSMGGHGALVTALLHPERFKSVSAFAPIVAPSSCPWGEKAFGAYLGPSKAVWADWDATELVKVGRTTSPILIDQGTADQFLETQLRPGLFETACEEAGQPLRLRLQEGYDHSYYMIQTFMEDHLAHHAKVLGA